MGRRFEALMSEAGLGDIGPGEGRLVYLIWRAGPLRQGELAARAGVDKSTLAITLARMERKSMVTREPDATDGRGQVVSLSPATAERAPAFEAVSTRMTELFYAGLSEAEATAFERTLESVLANLER